MKKRFALLVCIIILISFAGYLNYNKFLLQKVSTIVTTTSTQGAVPAQPPPTPIKPIPVHVSISGILADERSLSDQPPFINTSTGKTVSFRNASHDQTVNGSADLYVNQKKVGEVGGESISMPSFSPNNKYFAFRSQQHLGASESDFAIYVINLKDATEAIIRSPREEYAGDQSRLGHLVMPYIESYAWDGDNAVDITFYFVATGSDEGGKYYRISPEEIWRYDFINKSYILAETVSE